MELGAEEMPKRTFMVRCLTADNDYVSQRTRNATEVEYSSHFGARFLSYLAVVRH